MKLGTGHARGNTGGTPHRKKRDGSVAFFVPAGPEARAGGQAGYRPCPRR